MYTFTINTQNRSVADNIKNFLEERFFEKDLSWSLENTNSDDKQSTDSQKVEKFRREIAEFLKEKHMIELTEDQINLINFDDDFMENYIDSYESIYDFGPNSPFNNLDSDYQSDFFDVVEKIKENEIGHFYLCALNGGCYMCPEYGKACK